MATRLATSPRVSVIMTVGRDLRFLDEAVDSILRQDFGDFEFLIVDDGTGETAVFQNLTERDQRIRILTNPTNLGAAAAANRGIAASSAEIIVRLDADDIADPRRIGRLVSALDADPELGLIGSWCGTMDENGTRGESLHFQNPIWKFVGRFCFTIRSCIHQSLTDDDILMQHSVTAKTSWFRTTTIFGPTCWRLLVRAIFPRNWCTTAVIHAV